MYFQFRRFEGVEGEVIVPGVGVVAGKIRSWVLRREDSGPFVGQFCLHAAFSYVNETVIRDPDFPKDVILTLRRTKEKTDRFKVAYQKLEFEGSGETGSLRLYGCEPRGI